MKATLDSTVAVYSVTIEITEQERCVLIDIENYYRAASLDSKKQLDPMAKPLLVLSHTITNAIRS